MKSHKQLGLFEMKNFKSLFVPTKGKRKVERPLSRRHPMHLILKSKRHDLRKNERAIQEQWSILGRRLGIKTYRLVVVSDHIHAVVVIQSRACYRKFVSGFTGWLARRFQIQFRTSPATRIVEWGRAFKTLLKYVKLNEWEALGYIDYQPMRTRNLPEWMKL
ncbi:MAG: hypothetical protein AB7F86_03725 [Bdellovibrionales bacterium]